MTQEDKKLLLKDLCSRLPYGIKCKVVKRRIDGEMLFIRNGLELTVDNVKELVTNGMYEIKPYLFPLSSMTEEQRNDISKLLIDTQKEYTPYGELNMRGCDNLFICTVKQANVLINYCLTHHLDINGLIEKGLAIDATGLNIY